MIRESTPLGIRKRLASFSASYHYGNVVIPSLQSRNRCARRASTFLDCIVGGTCPQSCGEVGLKVVEVLEAAECSLHDGGMPRRIGRDGGQAPAARGGRRAEGGLPGKLVAHTGGQGHSVPEPVAQ